MKIQKIFTVFTFNLGILFLLIVGTEFLLRSLTPNGEIALRVKMNRFARKENQEEARGIVFDNENFSFLPNIKIPVEHSEYKYTAAINSEGWRVPCLNKSQKVDMFLIGDSFVFGTGVADVDTFSCAAKNIGKNLYTLGIPGGDTTTYLKIVEKNKDTILKNNVNNLSKYRPKIVLSIFTGNDYETLLNPELHQRDYLPKNTPAKIKSRDTSASIGATIRSIIKAVNDEIVLNNRFGLGDSYVINGIKLIAIRQKMDGQNFYRFYGGSTFYSKNAPSDKNVIASSLALIKNRINMNGFDFGGLLLIPDPAEISASRFKRDATLRGILGKIEEINRSHKFENIIAACKTISLDCIDTRNVLDENDYFIHDNHLNKNGVKKIVKNYL